MRKMYSLNQLKEIVNKHLESGNIDVINVDNINADNIGVNELSATKINDEENPSVKPIYWHTLKLQRGGTQGQPSVGRLFGYVIILNNSSTPFSLNDFLQMLKQPNVSLILHSGLFSGIGGSDLQGCVTATRIVYNSTDNFDVERIENGVVSIGGGLSISTGWTVFEDLGANKIN